MIGIKLEIDRQAIPIRPPAVTLLGNNILCTE